MTTEFGKKARAAGHLPIKIYALECKDTGREWEFDDWDRMRMFWGTLPRAEQLRCRTVLRSVWRI